VIVAYYGYSELRTYGIPKKPVTLPQIFKGKQRESLVASLAHQLDNWGNSAFEHEGSAIVGIRSSLCLDGFSWPIADHEARSLVAKALKVNGATRPTWEQGQPEYSVPRENCKWCRMPIAEDDLQGGRNPYYCSPECARSAIQFRFEDIRKREHNACFAAYRLISKQNQASRECGHCRKLFKLDRKGSTNIYCSQACALDARGRVPERGCRSCGVIFRPANNRGAGKYCSNECYHSTLQAKVFVGTCVECGNSFETKTEHAKFCCDAHNKRHWRRRQNTTPKEPPKYDKTCIHCGSGFIALKANAILCSNRCNSAYRRLKLKNGVGNVIPLTFEIFDSWFREAA
jgi:hypothetical protein